MWLKDLPVDYGDAFKKLLWDRSSNWNKYMPAETSPESRLAYIIAEARFTCTNCGQSSSAHVNKKCLFEATTFASILVEEPGPLMKTWLLEYVRHPDVTDEEENRYTDGNSRS